MNSEQAELERRINIRIRSYVIPQLVSIFEEKNNAVDFHLKRIEGSFYLSNTFFLNLTFSGSARRLLIKMPMLEKTYTAGQYFQLQFSNEALFYKELVDDSSDFPMCYMAKLDPELGYVIVLENVCERGFFTSVKKVNVPMDYILAGLKSIALFHAYTYTLKERNPKKFNKIVKKIANIRHNEALLLVPFFTLLKERMDRPIKLLQSLSLDTDFVEKMTHIFEDSYRNVLLPCSKPSEPLATIIHGDCTINNIVFRKSQEMYKEGLDAMLLDFALLTYSSPSIDIATFLYMTCSLDDLREHFKEMFGYYHNYLTLFLKEKGILDTTKYSYEAFWKDYKCRALYGYVIAVFFLPVMTGYSEKVQNNSNYLDNVDSNAGGKVLTKKLLNILLHMRDVGLLDFWLKQ